MTLDEFKKIAKEHFQDLMIDDCDNITSLDVASAEAYVLSKVNRRNYRCKCNVLGNERLKNYEHDVNLSIAYTVLVRSEYDPEQSPLDIRRMIEDFMLSKGLLSFGF